MKLLAFILAAASPLWAACTGSSPNWTTTPDSASFATCWNDAVSAGGTQTITVSQGTATWSSQPTLNSISGNLTVIGQTTSSFSGTAGQSGYSATWGDNSATCSSVGTCITLSTNEAFIFSTTGTGFVRVTGMTFIGGASAGAENGIFNVSPASGQVGVRFDHNHVVMYPAGEFFVGERGYGLIDHNQFDDTSTGGGEPVAFGGDFSTIGYLNWQQSLNLGSNLSWIFEQNIVNFTGVTNGVTDGYFGANYTIRFNNISSTSSQPGGLGWGHGTDSGRFRSMLSREVYGNYLNNASGASMPLGNTRGGTALFFGNDFVGDTWTGVDLQYYRCLGQASSSSWGVTCDASGNSYNLNWTPVSAVDTNANASLMTLNAPDWAASHSYTCSSAAPCEIGPTSNNSNSYNFISLSSCTSGSTRPTFVQTFPRGTTTDNTCTWINVGGNNAASPAPGTAAGFLSTAPDTPCSSGGTCTYYFDSLGGSAGSYPLRDQPGRGPNQTLVPNYAWLQTGAFAPSASSFFGTDSATTAWIAANREYYNYTSSFTGATGVGSGALGSAPGTCTVGVAYWATDQGSWNQSGNGFGNGVLYKCTSTNTFTSYYTPYTYPDPLEGSTPANSSAPSLLMMAVRR